MLLLAFTPNWALAKTVRLSQSLAPGCAWTKPEIFCRFIRRSVWLLVWLSGGSYGQCVVAKDQVGRLVTTCSRYAPKEGLLMNRPDQSQALTTTTYEGSPYLSFPIYEDGFLELGANQPPIGCKIAFNLVTNQVLCQLTGDSVGHAILPDAFRVGRGRFVCQLGPNDERVYYLILYAGKSRVLAQLETTLRLTKQEPYRLEERFDGRYSRQERYFIELAGKAAQSVSLSKKSVRKVLQVTSDQRLTSAHKNKLTVPELVGAVARYDGFP